jgi:3-hydroxybutyryl-CoA dehydrogenase
MIQRIAVVGAGTMGAGLAELCALRGFSVKIYDASPEASCRAAGAIKADMQRQAAKGLINLMAADRAYRSIEFAKTLEEFDGADLVMEAASENLSVKQDIFRELSKILPDSILATNTSSLSVAAVAKLAQSPERVIGLHFFNPPTVMKLVEAVRTESTSQDVFREAWDFVMSGLKKTPVEAKDTPGFIVNRVMRPYYLESQRCALEGAGISALDRAAREIGQVPMGPFELMDLIGLDVNLAITKVIYDAFGGAKRLQPISLQEKLVSLGHTGRKAGKGFYLYREGKKETENPGATALLPSGRSVPAEKAWQRVIGAVCAEAEKALAEGVASRSDINLAVKLAMNFPRGPLEWQSKDAAK